MTMLAKQFHLILNFYLNPRFTIQRSSHGDYNFWVAGFLLLLGCLSSELSSHLTDKQGVALSSLILSVIASTLIFFLLLLLFESIVAFAAARQPQKIAGSQIIFFTLLSFAPSLLFTPTTLLCNALGKLGQFLGFGLSLLIIIYMLYLFILTLRTSLNITVTRLVLYSLVPLIGAILFLLALSLKIVALV